MLPTKDRIDDKHKAQRFSPNITLTPLYGGGDHYI